MIWFDVAPGVSTAAMPAAFSLAMSGSGTMPPTITGMSTPRARHLVDDEWCEGHVGAGQHRQADGVDVFVDCGRGDRLGRLEEPGVDHLVAGVAQDAGHDLDAAVVPIEADLGNEHLVGQPSVPRWSELRRGDRRRSPSEAITSPNVA